MSESYYDKSELQDTDSDYICLFCHTLLYENVQAKKRSVLINHVLWDKLIPNLLDMVKIPPI